MRPDNLRKRVSKPRNPLKHMCHTATLNHHHVHRTAPGNTYPVEIPSRVEDII